MMVVAGGLSLVYVSVDAFEELSWFVNGRVTCIFIKDKQGWAGDKL